MPLLTSPCQRCGTPLVWRVVDSMPTPFEEGGREHRPWCEVTLPFARARSVDQPQLVKPVTSGYVIGLDLETTGIPGRIENPEIIEIAAALLRLEDGAIVETFTQLIKPRGPLLAVDVHQITEEMLADAPYVEEGLDHFHRWRRRVQGAYQDTPIPLVSHNAAFELSFLDPCGVEGPWICTLIMSQKSVSGRTVRGYHSLSTIVERLGLSYAGAAHRALPDAKICAEVYWLMVTRRRIWDDLVRLVGTTLPDLRAQIGPVAPATASLILSIEVEMWRRLRRFQDAPPRDERPPPPRGPFVVPWSPPEVTPPYPYLMDDIVFLPLPELLAVVRQAYRAERLGLDLQQLAQLRSRPEFNPTEAPGHRDRRPAGPQATGDEGEGGPRRRPTDTPRWSDQPGPEVKRRADNAAAPKERDPAKRAPHLPLLEGAPPRRPAPPPPAEASEASRRAPHAPVYVAAPRPPRPTASDSRPPPRKAAEGAPRVSPVKPRFGPPKG